MVICWKYGFVFKIVLCFPLDIIEKIKTLIIPDKHSEVRSFFEIYVINIQINESLSLPYFTYLGNILLAQIADPICNWERVGSAFLSIVRIHCSMYIFVCPAAASLVSSPVSAIACLLWNCIKWFFLLLSSVLPLSLWLFSALYTCTHCSECDSRRLGLGQMHSRRLGWGPVKWKLPMDGIYAQRQTHTQTHIQIPTFLFSPLVQERKVQKTATVYYT